MLNDINLQEIENAKLSQVNVELTAQLKQANDVIDAIMKGDIDAIFVGKNEIAKVLVSRVADHTYKTFIDNMSEGVVTLQADGVILYSNARFARMVNLPLEKIVGTNFRRFVTEQFANSFESFFIENPDDNFKMNLSIEDIGGSRSDFVVSFNKLHLHNFEALNLVMTDITVQKNAEEKLMIVNDILRVAIEKRKLSEKNVLSLNERLSASIKTLEYADTELAAFAYIASHDLQEPLRKIFTYTSLLLTDYYDKIDDEGKHYINTLQASSERMRKLMNDILEYAGLSRPRLFTEVNLDLVIKKVILDMDDTVKEKNATIIINERLPEIEAMHEQIIQLFEGLLSNALKFIRIDVLPVIEITCRIVNGDKIEKMAENRFNEKFCIIHFKDNGIGFNEVYIDKIFTIFKRLNNKSLYKGTGMGLAICKKVVDLHNGFISAKGIVNEGAVFTVTLPVKQGLEQLEDLKELNL